MAKTLRIEKISIMQDSKNGIFSLFVSRLPSMELMAMIIIAMLAQYVAGITLSIDSPNLVPGVKSTYVREMIPTKKLKVTIEIVIGMS